MVTILSLIIQIYVVIFIEADGFQMANQTDREIASNQSNSGTYLSYDHDQNNSRLILEGATPRNGRQEDENRVVVAERSLLGNLYQTSLSSQNLHFTILMGLALAHNFLSLLVVINFFIIYHPRFPQLFKGYSVYPSLILRIN